MKKVTFGVYYQSYGFVHAEIPDDVEHDDVASYLQEHWDDYPLPSDASYVQDSDQLDIESIFVHSVDVAIV